MRVIPVLDVMGGQVVRAVGGRRDEYRPIESRLTNSTDPIEVARALLRATGAEELYVADLDAIQHREELSPAVADLLSTIRVRTWTDIGLRANRDVDLLPRLAHLCPVVASETIWDLGILGGVWTADEFKRLAFSIDLSDGAILGRWRKWGLESPRDVVGLAAAVVEWDIATLIVLDLAGVGTGEGPRTVDACRAIRAAFPKVELLTGGGVRTWDDIRRLEDAGADGVLVASALHDSTLTFPRPVG